MQLPNVLSQLCTFSFGSLFKTIFPFPFCLDDLRVAMLLAPGQTVHWASEPSTIPFLWETAEETWGRRLALIVAVRRCGRLNNRKIGFILQKQRKGKKKNGPVGGRLWILFESIWLKIDVIVCIIRLPWPEIVNRPLATRYGNLVARAAKFSVALAARKAQFPTLTSRVSPGRATVVLFSTKHAFSRQIKPGVLTIRRGQSNL